MTMTALLVSDKEDVVVASFNEIKLVDQALIQQIEKEFQTLTAKAAPGRKLLVEFSRVESMSSMMIGLIVRLHSQCKREGVRLKLCGASPIILELFRITGLRKVLEIYPDESKSLEAFGRPGPEQDR
jgi:anti-anti-sigma factor